MDVRRRGMKKNNTDAAYMQVVNLIDTKCEQIENGSVRPFMEFSSH